MKVICIRPKESAGLYFMHTYTCTGDWVCKGCGRRMLVIEEACHDDSPRPPNTILVCRQCGELIDPQPTDDEDKHMFASDRLHGHPARPQAVRGRRRQDHGIHYRQPRLNTPDTRAPAKTRVQQLQNLTKRPTVAPTKDVKPDGGDRLGKGRRTVGRCNAPAKGARTEAGRTTGR